MSDISGQPDSSAQDGPSVRVVNDDTGAPLRFVTPTRTLGVYYGGGDREYHLADYVPYAGGPQAYLCGKRGRFQGSRSFHKGSICRECFNIMALDAAR